MSVLLVNTMGAVDQDQDLVIDIPVAIDLDLAIDVIVADLPRDVDPVIDMVEGFRKIQKNDSTPNRVYAFLLVN